MPRKVTSTNFLNEQNLLHSCGVVFSLSLIGGRWKAAILFELMNGPQRFNQLLSHIDGITERMLALRLRELERDQLIIKKVNGNITYELSKFGKTVHPILTELSTWGLKNMAKKRKQND